MGGDHAHGADSGRGPLALALGITLAVLVAELIGAWLTGSLALLTDAAHMVTDAAGLTIALVAAAASSSSRPNDRRTWGLRRIEVIAALAQADRGRPGRRARTRAGGSSTRSPTG